MRVDRIDETRRIFVGQAAYRLPASLEIMRMLYRPDPCTMPPIGANLPVPRRSGNRHRNPKRRLAPIVRGRVTLPANEKGALRMPY